MTQLNKLIDLETEYINSFEDLVNAGNNYGCTDGEIIGTGRSDYTQEANTYNLSIEGKIFSLIDIPGIEGDESKFEEIIKSSLDRSHTIFYVNGSGKKIEKATLEKIKRYMHDGTSVYAVFNVHCKPKKERIPGIDKTYSEELKATYTQCREITDQTETELRSFLGKNYKGSISVNGLLSFCGLAFNSDGSTSIVYNADKSLRSDQKKYFKEYDGNCEAMLRDSNISDVQNVISERLYGFDKYIYDENIKKLKNRLREMIERISELKTEESRKIKGFCKSYDDFSDNCYDAKEEYIQSIRQLGYHAASDAFSDVKEELFYMIERDGGKTKAKTIQQYFDDHKNQIISDLQNALNLRMKQLQKDYNENIEDAVQRLVKDFDREQTKFKVSLSVDISIDDSFAKALQYDLKSFGADAFRVLSLAASGSAVGTLILPGLGSAVGGIIGAILGVFSSIWNALASKEKRINKAKEKLQHTIDEQIDMVDDEIRKQIKSLNFENKINESYEQICCQVDKQRKMMDNINRVLDNVESELKYSYKTL